MATEPTIEPKRTPASRGGTLGVRTQDRTPPDVTLLAKAIVGHVFSQRYGDRTHANQPMASFPLRHTPTPRRTAS